jgi:2'-5' RNA ligase
MTCFRDALQKHLKPFGIKREKRPFRPHLTIGRFRKGARPGTPLDELLSKYQELTSPVCALKGLTFFRSDLKPGGALYSELKTWPLVGEI